ncbi:MAG: type II toxin-antitoxin system Phd/YefM family antitoxin [Candidatus Solibacter sp.]
MAGELRNASGKVLRRLKDDPKAVLLSIRDYVKNAAPEPEVLRLIEESSKRNGTDKLASRQLNQVIKAARAQTSKRR